MNHFRILYIVLFSLFISGAALAAPPHLSASHQAQSILKKVAIIGKDQRKEVPPEYKHISRSIGILIPNHSRGRWGCSAFCVADNVVATNAHCLIRTPHTGQSVDMSNVIFTFPRITPTNNGYAGTYNINYKSTMSPIRYVSRDNPRLSLYAGNYYENKTFRSNSHDWAFAKLKTPICRNRILKLKDIPVRKLQKASRKKKIFMLGYHGDDEMAYQRLSEGCRIFSPKSTRYLPRSARRQYSPRRPVLPHNCDTVTGSSGSPIIMSSQEGPVVIGINRGSFRYSRYTVMQNTRTGRTVGRPKLIFRSEMNMAVHTRAFLSGLDRFKSEDLLDNTEQFMEVQHLLKRLRLYRGRVDGLMGRSTRSAILKYERRQHLAPMGLPTKQLLKMLRMELDPIARTLNESLNTAAVQ
ncbi:MAG: trypsin-like peptidase domain-containing protein [Methyloligellaceae bacterium]